MNEKFTEGSSGEVLREGIVQQNLYKWLGNSKMDVKGKGCEGVRQGSSVSIVIRLRGGRARICGVIPGRIKRSVFFQNGDSGATTYSDSYSIVNWNFFPRG